MILRKELELLQKELKKIISKYVFVVVANNEEMGEISEKDNNSTEFIVLKMYE